MFSWPQMFSFSLNTRHELRPFMQDRRLLQTSDGCPVPGVPPCCRCCKVYNATTNALSITPGDCTTTAPTKFPTRAPTPPTGAPTKSPTRAPTPPTGAPTKAPTPPTGAPTGAPTGTPTPPTGAPTKAPTGAPTKAPTGTPTPPTLAPTGAPTGTPTAAPTEAPTCPPYKPHAFYANGKCFEASQGQTSNDCTCIESIDPDITKASLEMEVSIGGITKDQFDSSPVKWAFKTSIRDIDAEIDGRQFSFRHLPDENIAVQSVTRRDASVQFTIDTGIPKQFTYKVDSAIAVINKVVTSSAWIDNFNGNIKEAEHGATGSSATAATSVTVTQGASVITNGTTSAAQPTTRVATSGFGAAAIAGILLSMSQM
jgi:hypothetical protein